MVHSFVEELKGLIASMDGTEGRRQTFWVRPNLLCEQRMEEDIFRILYAWSATNSRIWKGDNVHGWGGRVSCRTKSERTLRARRNGPLPDVHEPLSLLIVDFGQSDLPQDDRPVGRECTSDLGSDAWRLASVHCC